jgi:energy-coupling factor transporter transmembrane protein EcfT
MGARLRSWWQIVRKSLAVVGIMVACVLGITLIVVIALAYIFNVNIPGLHGKTLWDWLQLLIIPLVLAVIALLFNRATTRTEQKIASRHYHEDQLIAKKRYEQDQQLALDKQREDLLQTYLDRMSELLLKEKLRSSEVDAEVRNVARVRTITILFQLDARRIGYVFAFLDEAGLMSHNPKEESIVSFYEANLEKINFSQANLRGANLRGANLRGANLRGAILRGAILDRAILEATDLSRAYFYETGLSGANLSGANLSGANLVSSSIDGADLNGADLRGTIVREEQLNKAYSLKNATLPDGSTHP